MRNRSVRINMLEETLNVATDKNYQWTNEDRLAIYNKFVEYLEGLGDDKAVTGTWPQIAALLGSIASRSSDGTYIERAITGNAAQKASRRWHKVNDKSQLRLHATRSWMPDRYDPKKGFHIFTVTLRRS